MVKKVEAEEYLNFVNPLYYTSGGNSGLAVEPYKFKDGSFEYDETRAFVVMEFPYFYPQTVDEPEETEVVNQAFYRSSGSNSNAQFGEGVTDLDARGTWIPTNGLVVKPGYREMSGVCVLNSGFILKQPFVSLENSNILSRFHGDSQLALISYLMGGGIWNIPSKISELSYLLNLQNIADYTKYLKPGSARLGNNVIPALSSDINRYIANAVSWNWHPLDMSFLNKIGLKELDLNDDRLWIENRGRYFIPETVFVNPGVVKNYKRSSLHKYMDKSKVKQAVYGSITNAYNTCPWNKDDSIEMYPSPETNSMEIN